MILDNDGTARSHLANEIPMAYGAADTTEKPDVELGGEEGGLPKQWQLFGSPGLGLCELQGYEAWTDEEKGRHAKGELTAKWGVGQVSVRLPVGAAADGQTRTLALVAVVYGFVPYLFPLFWIFHVIWEIALRGHVPFFPACAFCLVLVVVLINELIIKQACDRLLAPEVTSRPPEAVCTHPGMPSGHTIMTYTVMVWCLLEVAMDKVFYLDCCLLILLLLAPVPWARVYNRDHTVQQVLVSVCIATVAGILAYLLRRYIHPGYSFAEDHLSLHELLAYLPHMPG